MKRALLLYSTIALLAVTAVSCKKSTDSPAPTITGYYEGHYTKAGDAKKNITLLIRDDNTASVSLDEDGATGSFIVKNNTFSGKFYRGDEVQPLIILEGTIIGAGKEAILKGTMKFDGYVFTFTALWVSATPPPPPPQTLSLN